ncbi:504_t:CDS:2, partial [Racocetra persica]
AASVCRWNKCLVNYFFGRNILIGWLRRLCAGFGSKTTSKALFLNFSEFVLSNFESLKFRVLR